MNEDAGWNLKKNLIKNHRQEGCNNAVLVGIFKKKKKTKIKNMQAAKCPKVYKYRTRTINRYALN